MKIKFYHALGKSKSENVQQLKLHLKKLSNRNIEDTKLNEIVRKLENISLPVLEKTAPEGLMEFKKSLAVLSRSTFKRLRGSIVPSGDGHSSDNDGKCKKEVYWPQTSSLQSC